MLCRNSRNRALATSVALGLVLGTFPALAQTPAKPGDSPAAVPAPGNAPAQTMERGATQIVEGAVTKVDPGAGTVEVSEGAAGGASRVLAIVSETQIAVNGRPGTLADLQEGTKVKAAYEPRDGKDVVLMIEAAPAQ